MNVPRLSSASKLVIVITRGLVEVVFNRTAIPLKAATIIRLPGHGQSNKANGQNVQDREKRSILHDSSDHPGDYICPCLAYPWLIEIM